MLWDKSLSISKSAKKEFAQVEKLKINVYRGYTKVPYYRSSVSSSVVGA